MKIIEALKQVKDLTRKANDIRGKIGAHCAYLSIETPVYGTQGKQTKQISEWLQAHSDILKEILRLRVAIQRTNLETEVEIELAGKHVKKTIAEWIHRRRDIASMERDAFRQLGNKGLQEGKMNQSSGEPIEVKIIRCYDPAERDVSIEAFTAEPTTIDSRLEVVNAVTDLIE